MKSTDNFKQAIGEYLAHRAESDPDFATRYAQTERTLDDVVTYILNVVSASDCYGFTDEEIYGMAVHVIDEPDIEIGNPIDGNVVVNHHVELTEEEKAELRERAKAKYLKEQLEIQRKRNARPVPKTATREEDNTLSLFD